MGSPPLQAGGTIQLRPSAIGRYLPTHPSIHFVPAGALPGHDGLAMLDRLDDGLRRAVESELELLRRPISAGSVPGATSRQNRLMLLISSLIEDLRVTLRLWS